MYDVKKRTSKNCIYVRKKTFVIFDQQIIVLYSTKMLVFYDNIPHDGSPINRI